MFIFLSLCHKTYCIADIVNPGIVICTHELMITPMSEIRKSKIHEYVRIIGVKSGLNIRFVLLTDIKDVSLSQFKTKPILNL